MLLANLHHWGEHTTGRWFEIEHGLRVHANRANTNIGATRGKIAILLARKKKPLNL
jgi:hypothetical protein